MGNILVVKACQTVAELEVSANLIEQLLMCPVHLTTLLLQVDNFLPEF